MKLESLALWAEKDLLTELNAELNLDKRENELVDDAEEQGAPSRDRKEVEREER